MTFYAFYARNGGKKRVYISIASDGFCFNKLPSTLPPNRVVEAGDNLARELSGASLYNLRGFIFQKLCAAVCREGFHIFQQVKEDPQQLLEIVLER